MRLNAYLGQWVGVVAFSPDGTRLAAQSAEGIVRIYATQPEDLIEIARSRLTRWFTPEECRQYLHTESCPPDTRPGT
jgi:hypothetical protein